MGSGTWARPLTQQCSLPSLLSAYRSLAPTAAAKRKITKTILQMSLEHHIVTPLTAMVIESEAGDERLLADSPPQDHSCCSGQCFSLVGRWWGSALTARVQGLDPLWLPYRLAPHLWLQPCVHVLSFLSIYFRDSLLPWSSNIFVHVFSKGILKMHVPLHTVLNSTLTSFHLV